MMTAVSKDCIASTLRFKMLGTTYTLAQWQSQNTAICRLSQAFVFSCTGLTYGAEDQSVLCFENFGRATAHKMCVT